MAACCHKALCGRTHRGINALEHFRCPATHNFFYSFTYSLVGCGSEDRVHLRDLVNDLLLVALRETSCDDQRL